MAEVTPGTTSKGSERADQSLRLFTAAAEHEWIAPFQPNDLLTGACLFRRGAH